MVYSKLSLVQLKEFLTLRKRYNSTIRYSRKSQISVWEPNFSLDKLYKKFFLIYTLFTMVILHSEFGLFEKLLEPIKKPFFWKNRYSKKIRKFPYVNLIFFLDKLYHKFFCFRL